MKNTFYTTLVLIGLTILILGLLIFGMYKIDVISVPKFLEDLIFKEKDEVIDENNVNDKSILQILQQNKDGAYEVIKITDISLVDKLLTLEQEENYIHSYYITYYSNDTVREFMYEVTSVTDLSGTYMLDVKVFEGDELVNYFSFDGKFIYINESGNNTSFISNDKVNYDDYLGKTSLTYIKNLIIQLNEYSNSNITQTAAKEDVSINFPLLKDYEINHVRVADQNYLQIILNYSEINQREELLFSVEKNILTEARSYLNDNLYFSYNNKSYQPN